VAASTSARRAVCAVALAIVAVTPQVARAVVIDGWVHDHGDAGVPPRPSGYTGLVNRFGQPCNDSANDSRSYWPSQSARNVAGYVYYHPYIGRDVGYNIRNHVAHDHRDGAVDYLVGGYNCRTIRGSTSWSTHAFGAAIDTNSARNPLGQDHWNGTGADGEHYGKYLPDIWRGAYPGHGFFWGLNWDSRPDPMHFQYVTNY
jgi:hypothetical protein